MLDKDHWLLLTAGTAELGRFLSGWSSLAHVKGRGHHWGRGRVSTLDCLWHNQSDARNISPGGLWNTMSSITVWRVSVWREWLSATLDAGALFWEPGQWNGSDKDEARGLGWCWIWFKTWEGLQPLGIPQMKARTLLVSWWCKPERTGKRLGPLPTLAEREAETESLQLLLGQGASSLPPLGPAYAV